MVKRLFILLIVIVLFLSTYAKNSCAFPTDTEYIPTQEYFETALAEINSAQSSICLVMYLISVSPSQPDAQPNQLLNALVNAKNRGVDVKVILDQNINLETASLDETLFTNKNQESYELLKRNNVQVFFDESQTFTHSKCLVIDNKTVLLGSANWSKSALTRNHETNLLVHSEDLAKTIIQDLNQIKLQENVPAILTPSVPLHKDFVTKKLLGEMASSSDERAFDTYLYFLKIFDQNKENQITLDYDHLAKSLGIGKMSPEDYRRQINKVLDKLESKYKLIKFGRPRRNQNTMVKLMGLPSGTEVSKNIQLPASYFKYDWHKTLTLSAKAMYLIYLSNSQSSLNGRFSVSRQALSKAYNISESFISAGNGELKKLNLLDIEYSSFENQTFSKRLPNIYILKSFYDRKELEMKLKNLALRFGQDKLERALNAAKGVSEDNNLKTIQTLIELENQYGLEVVERALQVVIKKSTDNPKRSAGYLINTIKSMGKEKGLRR